MTTSITTRSGKGSALTHSEMDANLTNLRTTADQALAATDTLTADKAEAAALGVANTDQNMGSFTGSTIADNVSAKVGMQSLETAVETKANATAVGVTSSAANMGTYTGSTIPDNETAKQNLQSLETAVETKANASAVGVTSSASNMGTYTGSTITDNQTAKQNIQELETAVEGRTSISILSYITRAQIVAGNSVSTALQAALDAAGALGGGDVWCPPVGAPYVVSAGVTIPHNCRIVGGGSISFYGADAPLATWASKGTWFQPTDTVNPCISMPNPGAAVIGVNFIYSQPEPSAVPSTPWTPTTYPYAIKVTHSYFQLKDICILNGTHGINIEYLSNNGGGTYSALENIWLGCYAQGIRYKNVNDTLHIRGIHHRHMWRVTNSNLVTYIEANAIGDTYEYCDNPMVDSVEYFQLNKAQYFKDSNVNAGAFNLTHAISYGQFDNILFNLCKQAIAVENGTTKVIASYGRVTLATDSTTAASADYAIDLNSDNVTVQFGEIRSAYVGRGILRVGNGTGGRVSIGNLFGTSQAYAQDSAGASAINVSAGAIVTLEDGGVDLQRPSGAGFRKVGNGLLRGPGKVLLGGGSVSAAANIAVSLTDYDLYRGIEIELINLLPATDGVVPQLLFSTDGGSTYLASGYSYALNVTTDGGTNAPTGNGSTTSIAMSHPSAMVGSAGVEGANYTIRLMGQQTTGLWPRATITGAYVDNSATPQSIYVDGAGFNELANDVDALKIQMSSGNIASGNYAVYGIL